MAGAGVIMTDNIRKALEAAKAAIWDKHYGKGLSAEYARSVSAEIDAALRELDTEDAELSRLREELRVAREALNQISECPDGKSKTWPEIDAIIRDALAGKEPI